MFQQEATSYNSCWHHICFGMSLNAEFWTTDLNNQGRFTYKVDNDVKKVLHSKVQNTFSKIKLPPVIEPRTSYYLL